MNILKLASASSSGAKISDRFDHHLVLGSRTSFIDRLKAVVQNRIETYKARARDEQGTEQVLEMSDSMLQDIGLTSNDRSGLKAGLISLDDLNGRREAYRRQFD